MQRSYSELQIMLAKAENKSQEEGQELRLLQERFNQNQLHITALENDIDWVWKTHARIGEIISQCSTPEGSAAPSVDVRKIMLDLEAKSIRIQALEDESKLIKSEKEQVLRELVEERASHNANSQQQQARILHLQRLMTSESIHNSPEGSIPRSKRNRVRTLRTARSTSDIEPKISSM